MVTLSLYRNLSHIFAIFGNILLQKVARNGNFIDLKVAKNGNNWLQIIAKIGNKFKLVTLSLYRNLSHIFVICVNCLKKNVAKNGNFY